MSRIGITLWLTLPLACAAPPAKPQPTFEAAFNGIWQSLGSADWDIQDHSAEQGPFPKLGVLGVIPPGRGIVEGNEIPYLPEAAEKRRENRAQRWRLDPEIKCYLPGVPRATYLPFPFEIIQSRDDIVIAYEYATANRLIHMRRRVEPAIDTWMGTSNGHWEGRTLVVDVTGFNDQTWFDRAGNFHSDALHVVERYTLLDPNTIRYEALVEDPKVFSRTWKVSLPLYRVRENNARLLEFKCVEFSEELLYGDYRKKPER